MSTESVVLSHHLILFRPLLLLPSIFLTSWSFPVSGLFISHDESIGASASASVLPVNIQGWFPLGLTALISMQSKEPSRIFSSTTDWKHQCFGTQPSLWSNSHIHTWLLKKKNITLTILTFVSKVMSLLFNTLSRFVTAFLPSIFFGHWCLTDGCHHLFYKLDYGFKWNAQGNIYKHQGKLSIASLFHLEKRRFPNQAGFDSWEERW